MLSHNEWSYDRISLFFYIDLSAQKFNSIHQNCESIFFVPHRQKKHLRMQVLFSMKRTLRCMKNEAGLRRTERHGRFASCERSECFTGTAGFRFTFADGKRFITDYVAIAREIAAAVGGFYFAFC